METLITETNNKMKVADVLEQLSDHFDEIEDLLG